MKKIYVLCGDVHHDDNVTKKMLENALGDDFILLTNPDEFPWDEMDEKVDLYISVKETNTTYKEDGTLDSWITPHREKMLCDYVSRGGGALFLHCGLVGYPVDSLYHRLSGGVFIEHPPIMETTYVPIKREHPIMKGVEYIKGNDEKYFCHIDVSEVDIFMCGDDPTHAGTIAGWCKEIGLGRTVSVTPGHTFDIADNPNMIRLIQNSINWLKRK